MTNGWTIKSREESSIRPSEQLDLNVKDISLNRFTEFVVPLVSRPVKIVSLK